MRIELPYLDRTLPLELSDGDLLALAEPNDLAPPGTEASILAAALDAPLDARGAAAPGLGAFLARARSVLVIVNDATRPTPSAAMLAALLPRLAAAGLGPDAIDILVATGAHRAPTEDEYRQVLGGLYPLLRRRCSAHDARLAADLVDLGATRNGTPLLLNRRLFEADRIIATGSVEPHYFAGYTGGRKAFLPGVAGFATVEANHKLALDPRARSLALDDNPVHQDMMDALALVEAPSFSLMTVLDRRQRTCAAYAGDLAGAFYAAVATAQKVFCVSVPDKADVVVSTAKFPMDIDLYQSQKALDNGACALRDGGTLILVSSCRDGVGDEGYAKLLSSAASPADALARIGAGYRLGYHKAAKMAELSARASVVAFSELDEGRLASLFMRKAAGTLQSEVDAALAEARSRGRAHPKVLVLPDGCVTVPLVAAAVPALV